MIVTLLLSSAALSLSSLPLQVSTPPQAPAAAADSAVAGTWIGEFGGIEWTFDVTLEDGKWSGRYMTATSENWRDLQNVAVSGRSVSFAIVSSPQLSFALALDASSRTLSGTASLPSGMSRPFSAARKS